MKVLLLSIVFFSLALSSEVVQETLAVLPVQDQVTTYTFDLKSIKDYLLGTYEGANG